MALLTFDPGTNMTKNIFFWLLFLSLHNFVLRFNMQMQAYAFQYTPLSSKSWISSDRLRRTHTTKFYSCNNIKINNDADIDNVERIYAISDLHTDNISNLEWLKEHCTTLRENKSIGPNDALIIAGDISHELSRMKETFCIIQEKLNCHLFFVWGNHEAWIGGEEMDNLGIKSSLQKIDEVTALCDHMGVYTEYKLVGTANPNPAFVVPVEGFYDGTLSLEKCEDLCQSFDKWRWVDFMRCEWPDEKSLLSKCINSNNNRNVASKQKIQNIGKIPKGLTEYLFDKNTKSILEVEEQYTAWLGHKLDEKRQNPPGLITFSHFLPNQQTLPDWKDPSSDIFRREWLDHPVPDLSAKFAKVAGSSLIDEQIRAIVPQIAQTTQNYIHHLHVFGHSHRPKDFVANGIRYIHNPLGKPAEREMNMVSEQVHFQLIWDCTKQSESNIDQEDKYVDTHSDDSIISSVGMNCGASGGEIPGPQIIRYWEEKGGGKKVLARKIKHRKLRRKIEVKRFVRSLKLSNTTQKVSQKNECDRK
mmetsp:Transcript_18614/g.21494  ORF Transcript_18614/g.21494 Transcript_18614/m.21494 type:complete len:530 (-) Transcript_18614:66-1655(-)